MTFLPIVQRELRVAARKPSTYRSRIWVVGLTSAIAAILLLIGDPGPGRGTGSPVFHALATLAFLYCLIAGVRYTADCLSEEKREGTLGLLFLTDLRGYDIVLGKLMSVSARTFQGLFAFLPVLSIGLLIGGVTVGEFWRTAAVLTNALFFSLCVGLWVSSLSRESHTAVAGAVCMLILLTSAPLVAEKAFSIAGNGRLALVSFASPGAAALLIWDAVYQNQPLRFWGALVSSHLLGWSLLFFASRIVPRSWQERAAHLTQSSEVAAHSTAPPRQRQAAEKKASYRRQLLDINPIYWLASRHERQRLLQWIFVAVVATGGTSALLLTLGFAGTSFGAFTMLGFALGLVLKVWVSWQACATLAEARSTGAVELMLATPLTVEEIIRGHWQALQRNFFWPGAATLTLLALPVLEAVIREPPSMSNFFWLPVPGITLFHMTTFVLDLLALAWVGMWMGLSQPKAIQGFAKTIVFVIVVPSLIFCVPNIVFDLFWISWARRQLENQFRKAATERYAPPSKGPAWLAGVGSPPLCGRQAGNLAGNHSR